MAKINQEELFKAETTWFHIFKAMIDSGDAAKMGGGAFLVYSVIKAHTNFKTGCSFPSLETISEKSGYSKAQVKRSINTLVELGYIRKEKKGRQNVYTLREKVNITDDVGRPQAVATWDYLPSTVKESVADLKNVMLRGDLAGAKIVHIEKLTLNFNLNVSRDSSSQTNFNISSLGVDEEIAELAKSDPKLAEIINRAKKAHENIDVNQ